MTLQDDILRLEEKVDGIADTVAGIAPWVSKTDREVFGNGRPALSVQIAEIKTRQKLSLKVLGAIGGAGLTVLTAILIALLT
jgi:hypothetical protein